MVPGEAAVKKKQPRDPPPSGTDDIIAACRLHRHAIGAKRCANHDAVPDATKPRFALVTANGRTGTLENRGIESHAMPFIIPLVGPTSRLV